MPNTQIQSCKILGHTRILAEDQEEFDNLYIRDETGQLGENIMVSEWKPTEKQLALLNSGHSIYLGIQGVIFQPAYLVVGPSSPQTKEEEPPCG